MLDKLKKMLLEKAMNWVIKNWKTTLIGVLGTLIANIPQLAPHKEEILQLVIMALAILAKDGDQTGVAKTENPAAPRPVEPLRG